MHVKTHADVARIKGSQQFLAGLLLPIPGIQIISECEIWRHFGLGERRDRVDLLIQGAVELVIEIDGLYRKGSHPSQVLYSAHTTPRGRAEDMKRDAAIFHAIGIPTLRAAAHDESCQLRVLDAVKYRASKNQL